MMKKMKYIILLTLGFIMTFDQLKAQTTTKTSNGPWSNVGNWDSGVPNSVTNAIINTNNTNLNVNGECAKLDILANNRVNVGNGNTLTVYGTLNLESGTDLVVNGEVILQDDVSFSGNTVITNNGQITFGSSFNIGQ